MSKMCSRHIAASSSSRTCNTSIKHAAGHCASLPQGCFQLLHTLQHVPESCISFQCCVRLGYRV
jgi:hypothetical protein